MGVNGWTRNNPDGTVELDIECNENIFDDFIERLKTGNHWAKVKNITVEDSSCGESYKTFEIRE